ncbi:glutathione S-transferase [Ochromonadaceae sp. CCMP2298]|nr:glutathione S-transferase [Ochromonadaceae sp. CCMP2298]|mmetsp:Transcript_31850/g.70176  ORF Transcript_31850/g.70176 Transcript_31850/m.70176 type:complete len:212 (+) Transcript_31850:87-722(+)
MLTVHHLNNSRSQRILWLLEELGLEYQLKTYQRDPETNLAPPELEQVHPLGKSPVLTDGAVTIIESGAIIDYILRHHGAGRLQPEQGTDGYEQYLQWLHYAEGSAMLPMMLKMYTKRLGDAGAPLQPRIGDELQRHLGYIENALQGVDWLVDNCFSGADIQLSFVVEIAPLLYSLETLPNIAAYRQRFQQRPAYKAALERGGVYAYGSDAA